MEIYGVIPPAPTGGSLSRFGATSGYDKRAVGGSRSAQPPACPADRLGYAAGFFSTILS